MMGWDGMGWDGMGVGEVQNQTSNNGSVKDGKFNKY